MLPIKHLQSTATRLLYETFFSNKLNAQVLFFCSLVIVMDLDLSGAQVTEIEYRFKLSLSHIKVQPGSVKVFERSMSELFQDLRIAPIAFGTPYMCVPNNSQSAK